MKVKIISIDRSTARNGKSYLKLLMREHQGEGACVGYESNFLVFAWSHVDEIESGIKELDVCEVSYSEQGGSGSTLFKNLTDIEVLEESGKHEGIQGTPDWLKSPEKDVQQQTLGQHVPSVQKVQKVQEAPVATVGPVVPAPRGVIPVSAPAGYGNPLVDRWREKKHDIFHEGGVIMAIIFHKRLVEHGIVDTEGQAEEFEQDLIEILEIFEWKAGYLRLME